MATIGQINIAMGTDTSGLSKGLNSASSQLHDFTGKIGLTSKALAGMFAGLATGAATAAIAKMAEQAAHLQESFNKIDAVFGPASAEVSKQAKDMAGAFGISVTEMTDAVGRMGSMFRGAGFDPKPAAEYSNALTRLATDLSRFNDTSFETAFDKLRSGLSGESEPLRDFGVFLTEDLVKTRALAMGLGGLNGELSESAKMQARANLIMEQAGPAIGAAAREADGASAKMEALRGRWENLTTAIGDQFAPVVGDAMGGLGTAIQAMGGYWQSASAAIAEWGGSTLQQLGLVGEGVNLVEVAFGGLANAWQVMSTIWHGLQTAIVSGVAKIVSDVATVVSAFDTASEALTGWSTGAGAQLTAMADSMKQSAADMAKGVADEWNKPWASQGVSDYFQKIRDENEKLRKELAAKPLTLPIIPGKADAALASAAGIDPKKVKRIREAVDPFSGLDGEAVTAENAEAKLKEWRRNKLEPHATGFSGLALAGSREAASTVLRTRYGGAKDGTEANTKKTADGIAQLTKMMQAGIKIQGLPKPPQLVSI